MANAPRSTETIRSEAGTKLVSDLAEVLQEHNVGYAGRPSIERVVAKGIASIEEEARENGAEWPDRD